MGASSGSTTQTRRAYRLGDIIEVTIEKIVPRGFGLGFAENLTVFVPLSAPGDRLRVRIREKKKRIAFAEIVDILQAGPHRIEPPCEYFGVCGGCDFQQLDYATQLAAKKGIILDCLIRIGKIEITDEDIEMIASPEPFAYRSRARWHLDTPNKRIGYMRRNSNEVIDVASCPVLMPGMQSTLECVRENVDWSACWDDRIEIDAASGDAGQISTFTKANSDPPATVSVDIGGEKYSYSGETFFQANRSLVEKLIETAIGTAGGETALDLYSGVGLFTLPLARRFQKVTAVEEHQAAIDLAKTNVADAQLENVRLVHQSVERYLSQANERNADFVLLDPPRSGTEPKTIELMIAAKSKHLSYVSCEPSILARDLRILLDSGYAIKSITALDLFPQTHHVETVVHLA